MRKKIDIDLTPPREVDNILQNDYSFSLYYFAVSLVDVLYWPDLRSLNITEDLNIYLPWRDFWRKRIKELEKIKKYTQETWSELLHKSGPWLNAYHETVFQIEEKLKNLPRLINNLIENIKEDYLVSAKVRGTTSKPLNILFLVWSHFIKDKDNNEVHIQTLLSLLRWFSKRIGDFYFKEEDVEDDNLNKELHRFRRGELKTLKEKVSRYKNRFLLPAEHCWPEKSFNKKTKSNMPLIIFSNEEKLTIRDYLDNKSSPYSVPSSEKNYSLPPICLNFKSLSLDGDTWLWQVKLVKYTDEME